MIRLKKYFPTILALSFITLPLISFAQATPGLISDGLCNGTIENAGDVICKIGEILNMIIPLMVGIGIAYFVWGIVTFVIGNDEEAKKRGKDRIIYGIIGFVVISALFGIVTLVINTFGIDSQNSRLVSGAIQNNSNIIDQSVGFCTFSDNPNIGTLINYFTCLLSKSVIPLIFALAIAMFTWGVVQYVINGQEEAQREKGKQFMIWGILGLTVMVGVWGLVRIVGNTFGIENAIPQLK